MKRMVAPCGPGQCQLAIVLRPGPALCPAVARNPLLFEQPSFQSLSRFRQSHERPRISLVVKVAQPVVRPPVHALRLFGKRYCYVRSASQARPDFPRLRYPAVAYRFLLTCVDQAAAMPAPTTSMSRLARTQISFCGSRWARRQLFSKIQSGKVHRAAPNQRHSTESHFRQAANGR
jgi:hypothetical protein